MCVGGVGFIRLLREVCVVPSGWSLAWERGTSGWSRACAVGATVRTVDVLFGIEVSTPTVQLTLGAVGNAGTPPLSQQHGPPVTQLLCPAGSDRVNAQCPHPTVSQHAASHAAGVATCTDLSDDVSVGQWTPVAIVVLVQPPPSGPCRGWPLRTRTDTVRLPLTGPGAITPFDHPAIATNPTTRTPARTMVPALTRRCETERSTCA